MRCRLIKRGNVELEMSSLFQNSCRGNTYQKKNNLCTIFVHFEKTFDRVFRRIGYKAGLVIFFSRFTGVLRSMLESMTLSLMIFNNFTLLFI